MIRCIETKRTESCDIQLIRKYRQLLPTIHSPGFGYGPSDEDLVDFTYPQFLTYFANYTKDSFTLATRGQKSPGFLAFPKPKWMTNFWSWRGNFSICFSDDSMWAFNWKTMAWSTVMIGNVEGRDTTFPQDLLVSMRDDPDSMRLVRFLPSREDCTRIELRTFTFSIEKEQLHHPGHPNLGYYSSSGLSFVSEDSMEEAEKSSE